jgi:hypothetical protein
MCRTPLVACLLRTPGRPKPLYGIAQAAERAGDLRTAIARYEEFLRLWQQADPDRPELAHARRAIQTMRGGG